MEKGLFFYCTTWGFARFYSPDKVFLSSFSVSKLRIKNKRLLCAVHIVKPSEEKLALGYLNNLDFTWLYIVDPF